MLGTELGRRISRRKKTIAKHSSRQRRPRISQSSCTCTGAVNPWRRTELPAGNTLHRLGWGVGPKTESVPSQVAKANQ